MFSRPKPELKGAQKFLFKQFIESLTKRQRAENHFIQKPTILVVKLLLAAWPFKKNHCCWFYTKESEYLTWMGRVKGAIHPHTLKPFQIVCLCFSSQVLSFSCLFCRCFTFCSTHLLYRLIWCCTRESPVPEQGGAHVPVINQKHARLS